MHKSTHFLGEYKPVFSVNKVHILAVKGKKMALEGRYKDILATLAHFADKIFAQNLKLFTLALGVYPLYFAR